MVFINIKGPLRLHIDLESPFYLGVSNQDMQGGPYIQMLVDVFTSRIVTKLVLCLIMITMSNVLASLKVDTYIYVVK